MDRSSRRVFPQDRKSASLEHKSPATRFYAILSRSKDALIKVALSLPNLRRYARMASNFLSTLPVTLCSCADWMRILPLTSPSVPERGIVRAIDTISGTRGDY